MLWWRGFRNSAAREARTLQRIAQLYSELVETALSYDEPGMTRRDDLRHGFARMTVRARIGNGEVAFARAHEALSTGQMHRGAGLGMFPAESSLRAGTEFVSYLGVGPLLVMNPCRVLSVLDEPLRAGIIYGTLTGHPLRGEEEFVVELESGGTVWLTVQAVSKPDAAYARVGGLMTRRAQRVVAHRFVGALRRLARQQRQDKETP